MARMVFLTLGGAVVYLGLTCGLLLGAHRLVMAVDQHRQFVDAPAAAEAALVGRPTP